MTPPIEPGAIRPATARDAAPCAAMVNAFIDAAPWHPRVHTAEDVARHYRDTVWTQRQVWVAGDPPHGFVAIDADGCITALYADPPRAGTGTRLITHAKARHTRLRLWTHQPNTAAQAFYAAQGFTELRRTDGDNEESVPDVLLEWTR
ncbi:GNAT family N-acetyltransferase [Jannaschia donghaensis]|uniref:Putative acetyltransferase n=1 Tax=Jannaschia donghaensis TaxID=420998 RepID=A0A0M6YHM8_9RHOB|nr:GNAT family N-acetyltransferase [Jannaschia donghaensis]CTQ48767.1 putative acetyltransferase [Jannaschia donghaensis]